MKKKVSLVLLASFISMNVAVSAPNYTYTQTFQTPTYEQTYYPAPLNQNNTNYNSPYNQTLKGRIVTVPSGQTLTACVSAPISSETAYVGQRVCITLASDFSYNGKMIAPAGSTVSGSVIECSNAKLGSINGKLCIRFNQITTPYGLQIPISAVIKTADNSGVLYAGTKIDVAKEYAKDTVVGAATGALSGLVFGALAGGNVGRGAALGSAVGAGGGVVKSVMDRGNNVEIPAGAALELVLTQPVTVTPSPYDYEE